MKDVAKINWDEIKNRQNLYGRVVAHTGISNQLCKLCEEIAELIQVTSKMIVERARSRSDVLTFHSFMEEFVDVKIMIEQVEYLLQNEAIAPYGWAEISKALADNRNEKLDRLEHKLTMDEL